MKNKRVSVMRGKRFVAAYSAIPFVEAEQTGKNERVYPDYAFNELEGMYWAVRVGDIEVPWGFGKYDGMAFAANGNFLLSRKNVNAQAFYDKGLPFVKVGDVDYLYECELFADGFKGFSVYLRGRLLPFLLKIAKNATSEEFAEAAEKLKDDPDVQAILREFQLTFKAVTVKAVKS